MRMEPSTAFFSPGDACRRRIASRFQSCRRTADVCVFTITDDRITEVILDAHRRGVAVRVLTDNDKAYDLGSDIERLTAAGIPLRVDRTQYHMHHKFAIFDREHLLNGSYNWTRGAAEYNFENLTDTGETAMIALFQNEFNKLWEALG